MNKKSTSNNFLKEKNKVLSPKDSTIAFLINFARVYSCDTKTISTTGGYILN